MKVPAVNVNPKAQGNPLPALKRVLERPDEEVMFRPS
jgi:hypothetical protein